MNNDNNSMTSDTILVAIDDDILYNSTERGNETATHTYLAEIVNSSSMEGGDMKGEDMYDIVLITNAIGETTERDDIMTVPNFNIVSFRELRNITPPIFYHFSSENGEVLAKEFVDISIKDNPLQSSTHSGLGSGIYGLYISSITDPSVLKTDNNQIIYEVSVKSPYIVQDAEHGDSITAASIQTNIYIDNVLNSIQGNDLNIKILAENIDDLQVLKLQLSQFGYLPTVREKNNPKILQRKLRELLVVQNMEENGSIDNLLILWNIVFYRTEPKINITNEWLSNNIMEYIILYFSNTLTDYKYNTKVQILPINHIMMKLEYTGLLASDPYNNGWSRGCVNYEFSAASYLDSQSVYNKF
jgi:hypothetical protein